MKDKIMQQLEEAVAKAIAEIAVALLDTGAHLVIQKLQQLKGEE
jgi:H+/gluconate symporter-like permease